MKVALIQPDILWQDPKANLTALETLLDRAGGASLAVLPEMFAYGFVTQPEGVAEPDGGPALRWMKDQAVRRGMALAGSIPTELPGPSWRNRFHFVTPEGEDFFYDKRHLFTYGGEHLRYTAGDRRVAVEWHGLRILLQVCYDLRFPTFSRNRADAPYDLALYVASWPAVRGEAWSALLKARAIENQCFVAGVNRVGNDPSAAYDGRSVLLDPLGTPLAACRPSCVDVCVADIDPENLAALRASFPVLKDADR